MNDVSDFDYIGVRFWINDAVAADNAHGSTLDNVSLEAVPEPSTLIIWSLFAGLTGVYCWRRRRK